jgi:hypothetical protein
VNVPRLDDTQRAALASWWDLAQTAANNGYTTTDTITAASDLARQAGAALAFDESSAIATLYGYAKRMSNAAGELQAANPGAIIDPSMMGIPPWARDEQVMNTSPLWHASFQFTFIDQAGVQQTEFRTSVFTMTLPQTVGELAAAIDEDAQAMADKYNVQLVDATPIQLLAV